MKPDSIEPRVTVLQKRTCDSRMNPSPCGQEVAVKMNKSGIAYYFCDWCSYHVRWGRADSNKIIAAYLKSRAADAAKPRNIVTPSKPKPAPQKEPVNVKSPEPANLNRSPNERGTFDRLFG